MSAEIPVTSKRPSKLRRVAIIVLALGAAYGLYRMFTLRVERVTDTHLWGYDVHGSAAVGVPIDVEVRYPAATSGPFEHTLTIDTGADGRCALPLERVRKFNVPLAHASGAGNFEQSLIARLPGTRPHPLWATTGARAAQFVVEDGAVRHTLFFVHDYDPFRHDDAFSESCARAVEAFHHAEAFLVGPADAGYGKRVRERLFARAKAMGMTPYSDAYDGYVAIEVKTDSTIHCTVNAVLRDAAGKTPTGFDTPPP